MPVEQRGGAWLSPRSEGEKELRCALAAVGCQVEGKGETVF